MGTPACQPALDSLKILKMADTSTLGAYMRRRGLKILYFINLRGHVLLLPFGMPTQTALIAQRARWFRGLLYSFFYQKKSIDRSFAIGFRLFIVYLVFFPCMICVTAAHLSLFTGQLMFPAGSRSVYTDFFVSYSYANLFFSVIWGAWHVLPTTKALLITIAVFFWYGSRRCANRTFRRTDLDLSNNGERFLETTP